MKTYTGSDSNRIGYLRCPKCGGRVKYVEEVSGFFDCSVDENGYLDHDDKIFTGNSWVSVRCSECHEEFDWEWNDDYSKIILKEEDVNVKS